MNAEQKEYIEQNIDLIEDKHWEEFFKNAPWGIGAVLYSGDIDFMSDMKTVPERCFAFTDINSVIIPTGVTSIEKHAFKYTDLTSIDIPDSVTSIGDLAFSYCNSLTKVVINNYFVKFGSSVFYDTPSYFEIHGYKGSTAESYANKNGHKFVAID